MRKFIGLALIVILGAAAFSLHASDRTTRIVGGTEVTDARYPWMASVYFRSSGTLFFPGCGGSLISDRWILSAAHCFVDRDTGVQQSADDVRILLAALNLATDDGLFLRPSRIVVHPQYDPQTFKNDIALIELTTTVDIQPITLPTPANPVPQDGELATVAGWGDTAEGGSASSQLLEVDLPIVTHNSCLAFYPDSLDQTAMVCAGGSRAGGEDACQGDSGGPLFVPRGNQNVQAGVVSFGVGCARPGIPGVYTRLSSYFNWISGFVTPASVYDGQSESDVVAVPDAVETLTPNSRISASVAQGDTNIYLAQSTNVVELVTLQGDADLGVFNSRQFSEATLVCSSLLVTSTDRCELDSVGDYYVAVAGYEGSDYTLAVSNGAAPVTDVQVPTLVLDVPVQGSLLEGTAAVYRATSGNTATLTSISGDADLLVFSSENISIDTLLCRSLESGSALDVCNFNEADGEVYVGVYGFNATDYSLVITQSNNAPVVTPQGGDDDGGGGLFNLMGLLALLSLLAGRVLFYQTARGR